MRVAVVGAGAAGCAVAGRLAREGCEVVVFDRARESATGGSGNALGLITPAIGAGADPVHAFLNAACERFWKDPASERSARRTGVVQVPIFFQGRGKFPEGREAVAPAALSSRAGVAVSQSGLWFENGGTVEPRLWCQAAADHPRVAWRLGVDVASVCAGSGGVDLDGESFDACVLATAWESPRVTESALPRWAKLKRVGGQVFRVRWPRIGVVPCVPVVGRHYVLPTAIENEAWIGATQERGPELPEVRTETGLRLLKDIQEDFPSWNLEGAEIVEGRAASRAAMEDHMPMVGPVPRDAEFENLFASLKHGRGPSHWREAGQNGFVPGVFVCRGLGFRGLMVAPLLAEVIVAQILGRTPSDWAERLAPARFLFRRLKRD